MKIKSRYQQIREFLQRDIITSKNYSDIEIYVDGKLSNENIFNTELYTISIKMDIMECSILFDMKKFSRRYSLNIERYTKMNIIKDYINERYGIFGKNIYRREELFHNNYSYNLDGCILYCLYNKKNNIKYINEYQYLKLEQKIESLKILTLNYIFNNIGKFNIFGLPWDVRKYLV